MLLLLKSIGQAVLPALMVVSIAYQGLVTLNAPEGVRMNSHLEERLADQHADLAALQAERDRLADRARRLTRAELDTDFLEERVRARLGLVRPGEFMIALEDLDRLAERPAAPQDDEDDALRLANLIEAVSQPSQTQ